MTESIENESRRRFASFSADFAMAVNFSFEIPDGERLMFRLPAFTRFMQSRARMTQRYAYIRCNVILFYNLTANVRLSDISPIWR